MTDGFNTGKEYGLKPIGLSQADMNTGRSDTERRAFPGLATKSSVFAWMSSVPTLMTKTASGASMSETINLRSNTATGGSSVDVPTWAAGCVVTVLLGPIGMGGATYMGYTAWCAVTGGLNYLLVNYLTGVGKPGSGPLTQIIVPFYDEPVFTVEFQQDGAGTANWDVKLLGFVRNV